VIRQNVRPRAIRDVRHLNFDEIAETALHAWQLFDIVALRRRIILVRLIYVVARRPAERKRTGWMH
jgi:hypothetical protein